MRAPNHHLTEPWRFVVLAGDARGAVGEAHARAVARLRPGLPEAGLAKEAARLRRAPVVIACVVRPSADDPIAAREDRDAVAAGGAEPAARRPRPRPRRHVAHRDHGRRARGARGPRPRAGRRRGRLRLPGAPGRGRPAAEPPPPASTRSPSGAAGELMRKIEAVIRHEAVEELRRRLSDEGAPERLGDRGRDLRPPGRADRAPAAHAPRDGRSGGGPRARPGLVLTDELHAARRTASCPGRESRATAPRARRVGVSRRSRVPALILEDARRVAASPGRRPIDGDLGGSSGGALARGASSRPATARAASPP